MKNVNHLLIDKSLKKQLNKKIKEFRKYRFSEGELKYDKKKGSDFFGFLFKEYDSMNDLVKDMF
ncbi:hypothetical protein MHM83_10535 [Tenacibaculum sp. Mcav3-52]|uniref:hypothetical protein n=1 Tax=Tenacibaculum sp. Mcav3-52 TaxID=2917762 RepID=UPI001EF3038C|nr:hypothetical protein [Tenacibaculum sp. Mcav3-52]MCG7502309.1 hypothetical protein [Tenacibaculum sp. Mcav3-52]